MISWMRSLPIAFAAALLVAPTQSPVHANTMVADECRLEYTRANNMWGSAADSYKNLGVESITLQPGQKKAFVTDWRYEKTRNDGSTFYGSHGRTHRNRGTRVVKVTYKPSPVKVSTFYLEPGQSSEVRGSSVGFGGQLISATRSGDIVEVSCP